MLPVVVIAGRPNVGKSTLFNRLAGGRSAIVSDTPGVTRDRKDAEAMLRGRRVRLVDTAGLEESAPETLFGRMRASSEAAVTGADLILFVIDARAGVTPADQHFANWLRRQGRLTDADAKAIQREAVSVIDAAPWLNTVAQVVAGDKNASTTVAGTTLEYYPIRKWTIG